MRASPLFLLTALGSLLLTNVSQATSCIAHRGDTRSAVENSLAAFRAADENGADGIELDVQITRDGQAIVMHDDDLSRVARSRPGKDCDLQRPISRQTFEAIQSTCVLSDGEPIPTLEAVLQEFHTKDFRILLDFKNVPSQQSLVLLRRYAAGKPDQFKVMVRFVDNLKTIYRLRSRLPSGIHLLLSVSKLSPLILAGFDGVDTKMLSAREIQTLRRRGKEVSLYDLRSPSEIRIAVEAGADELTVDDLSTCLTIRNEKTP